MSLVPKIATSRSLDIWVCCKAICAPIQFRPRWAAIYLNSAGRIHRFVSKTIARLHRTQAVMNMPNAVTAEHAR